MASKSDPPKESSFPTILWLGVPMGALILWGIYAASKPSRYRSAASALAASEQKRLRAEQALESAKIRLASFGQLRSQLDRAMALSERKSAEYDKLEEDYWRNSDQLRDVSAKLSEKESERFKLFWRAQDLGNALNECGRVYYRDVGRTYSEGLADTSRDY